MDIKKWNQKQDIDLESPCDTDMQAVSFFTTFQSIKI